MKQVKFSLRPTVDRVAGALELLHALGIRSCKVAWWAKDYGAAVCVDTDAAVSSLTGEFPGRIIVLYADGTATEEVSIGVSREVAVEGAIEMAERLVTLFSAPVLPEDALQQIRVACNEGIEEVAGGDIDEG